MTSMTSRRSSAIILHSARRFSLLVMAFALGSPLFAQQAVPPTVLSNLDQASGALSRGTAALPSMAGQPVLVPEDFAKVPLTAGTLLDLRIYRVPEMSGSLRVDEAGQISVPLLGKIDVLGKTPAALQAELAQQFTLRGLLVSPQVNIDVLQYVVESTTVLGEVQMPGRIALQAPKSLPSVLAMVGGETIAAGSDIEIQHIRQPGGRAAYTEHAEYMRDASPDSVENVMINPGDTVFVRRAGIVYVLGAVTRPGGYLMVDRGSLDLTQAIALAQGTIIIASTKTVWIIRKRNGNILEIPVAYSKVVEGKEPSPVLESEDVLYVGVSKFKATLVNGAGILSSATSAGIYSASGR
jgi:polysaccharide export outer membrane protein